MKKTEFKNIAPITRLRGEDSEDTKLLKRMLAEAVKYLKNHSWCAKIERKYFGFGIGGILAVFLLEIKPRGNADHWVWVVVGDLPPAYISAHDNKTPKDAVLGYLYEMGRWAKVATKGKSVEHLIPVNVAASIEMAELLKKRLKFIKNNILKQMDDV